MSTPSDSESGSKIRSEQHSTDTLKRATAVWHGMKQIFGNSFVTIYGETPAALWLEQIARLTDAQCRAGLTRLAGQRRQYPANLTEFVEACKPTPGSPRFLGVPETPEDRQRLLSVPPANPDHVKACIARIRQATRAIPTPEKTEATT
jgi:hypothetical protein